MANDAAAHLNRLQDRTLKLFEQNRYEQALRTAEDLVAAAKAHLGERHPAVEQALVLHADMRQACGEPEEAERLIREALSIRRFLVGQSDPALVPALNKLAGINLVLERHAIAEPLAREAIEICRTLPDARRAVVAIPLMNLAQVHLAAGRLEEAESVVREAIEAADLGEEAEPATRSLEADAQAILAEVQLAGHELDSAIEAQRAALDIRSKLHGEGSAEIVNTRSQLGSLLTLRGDFEEADAMTVRAADAARAGVGEVSEEMVQALGLLGARRLAAGHRDEADRLLDASDAIRRALPPSPLLALAGLSDRADLYGETGELGPAVELVERAIAAVEPLGKALHPTLLGLLIQAAVFREALGHARAAAKHADRALSLVASAGGKAPQTRQLLLSVQSAIKRDLGDFEGALEACKQARSIRQEHGLAMLDEQVGMVAICMADLGDLEAAIADIRAEMGEFEPGAGTSDHRLARANDVLGFFLAARGDRAEAARCLRRAAELTCDQVLREHRQTKPENLTVHYRLRVITEALATLAASGDAEDGASALIAAAAHRLVVQPGLSDLELAAVKAPEEAGLVREVVHVERNLALALDDHQEPRQKIACARAGALRVRLRGAESAAAEAIPEFGARLAAWGCDAVDLVRGIGEGGVFVHLLRYNPPAFERRNRSQQRWHPARYLAVTISRDRSRCIDLGEAKVIDALAADFAAGDTGSLDALAGAILGPLGELPGGTVWIGAEGALAQLPFEALPMGGSGCLLDHARVVRVPAAGSLLMGGRAPVSAAAAPPVAVVAPELGPVRDRSPDPVRLPVRPRSSWWHPVAERFGFRRAFTPSGPVLDLSLAFPYASEVSAALCKDRAVVQPESGPPPEAPEGAQVLRGASASVPELLGARSPAWLWVDAPWGLLPDQPYVWGEAKDQAWVHRIPPRTEPDVLWHESAYCRAGVYLAGAGSGDAATLRRSPGVLASNAWARLDLTQTAWVALARPPRTPRGGPVGDALAAFADATFMAGARVLLAPRSWAYPASVRCWLSDFRRAWAPGASALEIAREVALAGRARGEPPQRWAGVAVFGTPAGAPGS